MAARAKVARTDTDTRTRILDTAERLLAENGVAATSVRMITEGAGVNIAAVNYHFGSKDEMVREVIGRGIAEIGALRLVALEVVLVNAEKQERRPAIDEVIGAFVRPMAEYCLGKNARRRHFALLMGRHYWDRDIKLLSPGNFEQIAEQRRQFSLAIADALGIIGNGEERGRPYLRLAVTVTLHMIFSKVRRQDNTARQVELMTDRLVAFISGGMKELALITPTEA